MLAVSPALPQQTHIPAPVSNHPAPAVNAPAPRVSSVPRPADPPELASSPYNYHYMGAKVLKRSGDMCYNYDCADKTCRRKFKVCKCV